MERMLDWIELEFMPIDQFIEKHDHIFYCEALIRTDGYIANVITSHQNCMIKICMEKLDMSYKQFVKHTERYLYAFTEYLHHTTEIVTVWYHGFQSGKMVTDSQLNSINLLINSGCCKDDAQLQRLNTDLIKERC